MDLASISAVADQKQRTEGYKAALSKLLASPTTSDCQVFVDHMLNADVPLVISRPILQHFVLAIPSLPPSCKREVALSTLTKMQPREVSFEEQLTALRELAAALLEETQDWSEAARVLAQIDLDKGSVNMSAREKLARYIKITMLYLEDEDAVSAEQYFMKASPLLSACDDPIVELQFKACYARISDSKRRFLDAALRYYELSQATASQSEESVLELLQAAVVCTILAPASAQRSRMLAMLYKDERAAAVPQFPFLEKMLMERVISKAEVDAFSSMLREHQQAQLPDGFTVLEDAVVQHNLRSVSKMYNNITFSELSALLGLTLDQAEKLASGMITESRLKGHIDQVDNVIHFDDDKDQLTAWDERIMCACEDVNNIIEVISGLENSA